MQVKNLIFFKGDARMAESIIRQTNRTLLIEEINPEIGRAHV